MSRLLLRGPAMPHRRSEMLVGLVVVLACATGIGAQAAPSSYGRVALVAEDDAFEADRVALIGVLFDLQPGWHISGRDGLRMTLKKSYRLVKPVSVLKGVMVLGPDRAFEIVALVSARR